MTEEIQTKFNAVHERLTSILADFITGGYADTFAKLLVYMGTEKAEETISQLPEPMKTNVLNSYKKHAQKKITDSDVISAAGYILKQADFSGKAISDAVSEGLTVDLLSELSHQTDALIEQDPLIALNLEQNLFVFEDLQMLDDRAIQKILREVEQQELAIALHGADTLIQDKIFRNLSRRAENLLKEDIEFMGHVRMADVMKARQNIMDIVMRLEENGEIVIASDDSLV